MGEIFTESQLAYLDDQLNNWFMILALIFLSIEMIIYKRKGKLTKDLVFDTLTNFITLGFFILIGYFIAGYLLINSYFHIYEYWSLFEIESNLGMLILCVVLADFIYYWEHRFMHRFGLGWATHAVHHSSPNFNISVAYRFGPLDGVLPFVFHFPLVFLGFNPIMIFFAEIIVQLYQTALHTELIGKLPRPIEYVMNTFSHHRVHHGSNEQYLDKNYAGIFIVWDRIFGTFEEEQEKVVYGLTKPINSVNPFYVFFHGLQDLGKQVFKSKSLFESVLYIIKPPGWEAKLPINEIETKN